MTYARKSLVCLRDTPYYHVIGRCVRRAWLCGTDHYAGRDYSHRKAWVLSRLERLSASFAVNVCAYAVMSNHYHLVLHIDTHRAQQWGVQEVIERWRLLFSVPPLVERWQQGGCGKAECEAAESLVNRWRQRLVDMSWYMRCLNEYLARRANAEDGCSGRFWEGRFKSQALLDEEGLLTAMAYVDLNPIRAGIAATPETSDFTSIQARLRELVRVSRAATVANTSRREPRSPLRLLGFRDQVSSSQPAIPFSVSAYVELVEWTARSVRADKRGALDARLPLIMERLNIDRDAWGRMMQPRGNAFGRAVGRLERLRQHAKTVGQCWVRGLRRAQLLYPVG